MRIYTCSSKIFISTKSVILLINYTLKILYLDRSIKICISTKSVMEKLLFKVLLRIASSQLFTEKWSYKCVNLV